MSCHVMGPIRFFFLALSHVIMSVLCYFSRTLLIVPKIELKLHIWLDSLDMKKLLLLEGFGEKKNRCLLLM